MKESRATLYYYLANLLLFIAVLAFWLGLILIGTIAMLLFWGDKAFNPTVEDFDLNYLSEEFHTKSSHDKHELLNAGHHHKWHPFDFSEVQLSVWFSFVPATFFLCQNIMILAKDSLAEFYYFRDYMHRLTCLKYLALL